MEDVVELVVKFRRPYKNPSSRPEGARTLHELFAGISGARLTDVYGNDRYGKVELKLSEAQAVLGKIDRYCIASEVVPAMPL